MKIPEAIQQKYMVECLRIKATRYLFKLDFEGLKQYLHKIRNLTRFTNLFLHGDRFLVVYRDDPDPRIQKYFKKYPGENVKLINKTFDI